MAIKFTAKDEPAAAKERSKVSKADAPEPKDAVGPAEESELFPAAPKPPSKKRKLR